MAAFWFASAAFIAVFAVTDSYYNLIPDECEQHRHKDTKYEDWGINRFLPDFQFGFYGQYEVLACCATNYDTITWEFKNKPFPWFDRIRKTDYKLDGRNQTLAITKVLNPDEGNYTCIVTKGDQTETHTTMLSVAPAMMYSGPALMTKVPVNKTVAIGKNVTLPCEGWFGSSHNPLENRRAQWTIKSPNMTNYSWVKNFPRYHDEKKYRQNRLYIGSYLTILNVQEEDYDVKFRCYVANSIKSNEKNYVVVHLLRPDPPVLVHGPYRDILAGVAGFVIAILMVVLIVWYYWLEIRIYLRHHFSKSELTDSISHSAFVVYSEESTEDSNFVTDVLLEAVEDKMKHSILISDRDFMPGAARAEEYVRCMNSSARFVVILSPEFLNDTWCDFALNVALEGEKHIIFVVYKEIKNWEEFKNQRLMKSIVSIKHKLKWPKKETDRKLDKFYKKLELYLPPHGNNETTKEKSTNVKDVVIQMPTKATKATENGMIQQMA